MKVSSTHITHLCQGDTLTLNISLSLTGLPWNSTQLDQILSWPLVEQHLGHSLGEAGLVALEGLQLARLRDLMSLAAGAEGAPGAKPPKKS